jgi:predicted HTH transcriptional regulator
MTSQDIYNLLANGERVTLECKKAKNEVPKSMWDTYSAFANTLGGDILLGIDEDTKEVDHNKRFTIVGVENTNKIKSDIWNTVNRDKVNLNILSEDDVSIITIDGKDVVCIHVPQTVYKDRPIFINGNPLKGAFKRNHEGDFHCTDSEVKTMLRDASDEGNDDALVEYYGMDDIDPDSLRGYRQQFRILNDGHTWNNDDDKTFLKNLHGYTIAHKTGKEGLTIADLLMFEKGLSVRERFGNFRMDYLDMSHLIGDERYSDRLTYDGRWENNLYQFFRIVLPKLTFDLPRPFKMEGMVRT